MSVMASKIAGVSIVDSTVCSNAVQRKHQSSALLAFVRGIHRWPVNSPRKKTSKAEKFSIWWRHHAYAQTGICQENLSNNMVFDVLAPQFMRTHDIDSGV